jgi:hypothetical protein
VTPLFGHVLSFEYHLFDRISRGRIVTTFTGAGELSIITAALITTLERAWLATQCGPQCAQHIANVRHTQQSLHLRMRTQNELYAHLRVRVGVGSVMSTRDRASPRPAH